MSDELGGGDGPANDNVEAPEPANDNEPPDTGEGGAGGEASTGGGQGPNEGGQGPSEDPAAGGDDVDATEAGGEDQDPAGGDQVAGGAPPNRGEEPAGPGDDGEDDVPEPANDNEPPDTGEDDEAPEPANDNEPGGGGEGPDEPGGEGPNPGEPEPANDNVEAPEPANDNADPETADGGAGGGEPNEEAPDTDAAGGGNPYEPGDNPPLSKPANDNTPSDGSPDADTSLGAPVTEGDQAPSPRDLDAAESPSAFGAEHAVEEISAGNLRAGEGAPNLSEQMGYTASEAVQEATVHLPHGPDDGGGPALTPFMDRGQALDNQTIEAMRAVDAALEDWRRAAHLDAGDPLYGWGHVTTGAGLLESERWKPGTTPLLGRLPDTKTLMESGAVHRVTIADDLDPKIIDMGLRESWTPRKNREWVQSIIDQGGEVEIATEITLENLWGSAKPSVFAFELKQLFAAGYTLKGRRLVPSGKHQR
jgi:hypothetical protein